MNHSPNFQDLTGKVFHKLTVIKYAGSIADGFPGPSWDCICRCGNTKTVIGSNLKQGTSRSCGCLQKQLSADRLKTHGMTGSPEYMSWKAMWDRCTNKNDLAYPKYSAFAPVETWKDFGVFLLDMGRRPSKAHTLERIDGTKGYSPDNCRWATWHDQMRNTSRNVWVWIGNERRILTDWVALLRMSREKILSIATQTQKGFLS